MEPQDSAAIVRKVFDAFNDRDFDRIDAMVSEDFELVDFAAEGQGFRGPQGLREWHQVFLTAFPDAKVELANVVAAGEEGWVFIEQQVGAPTRARWSARLARSRRQDGASNFRSGNFSG